MEASGKAEAGAAGKFEGVGWEEGILGGALLESWEVEGRLIHSCHGPGKRNLITLKISNSHFASGARSLSGWWWWCILRLCFSGCVLVTQAIILVCPVAAWVFVVVNMVAVKVMVVYPLFASIGFSIAALPSVSLPDSVSLSVLKFLLVFLMLLLLFSRLSKSFKCQGKSLL